MSVVRWEPMRDFLTLREAMNRLFEENVSRPGAAAPALPNGVAYMDAYETEGEFVFKVSLPGVKADDVDISIIGDVVTIKGEVKGETEEKKDVNYLLKERRYGQFSRSVTLAVPVEADKATAQFENGILTLTLPKAEAVKPKQIKVLAK